ncbi:MAG: class I SAM-dependent methyltransferase [Geminicoccaceae bacterium]
MGIRDVHEMFPDLPYMKLQQAEVLEQFLRDNQLTDCLELGFYHGKSSAFIAAILSDMGRGHLLTIDRRHALDRKPTIHDVLKALDLESWVTVSYEQRSYTWKLMRMLEEKERPAFDFCYIDAAHTWDDTGFAFFLVDKFLKPGGWMLFDDLDFEYQTLVKKEETIPEYLLRMGQEERTTKQVRHVWELLVKEHPNYGGYFEHGTWAFTRKNKDV